MVPATHCKHKLILPPLNAYVNELLEGHLLKSARLLGTIATALVWLEIYVLLENSHITAQ